MDTLPESVTKILAMLVPRMTGLERLSLSREPIFTSYSRLLPAFVSLCSVRIPVVLDAGARCCEPIRTLRWKLVIAKIHFNRSQAATPSLSADTHPIVILQRSATTLQSLSCSCLCNTNPELAFFPPEIPYPNLRTLTLVDSLYPDPVPFVCAAPNLAHLTMENEIVLRGGHPVHVTEIQRGMNLQLQAGDGGSFGADSTPAQWKHMRSFTGCVVDL